MGAYFTLGTKTAQIFTHQNVYNSASRAPAIYFYLLIIKHPLSTSAIYYDPRPGLTAEEEKVQVVATQLFDQNR